MDYPTPNYGVVAPSAQASSTTKTVAIVLGVLCSCGIICAVAIALGVGLGVGLSRKNSGTSTSSSNYSILSAPVVNCTYGGSSTCGCSAVQPTFQSPRIVQGYTATAHSWPWVVAIFINSTRFCGGFLVTYQHVVTAAHCVYDEVNSPITVYAGIQQLSALSVGQSRTVATVSVNSNFNIATLLNDVAILTLQSAFDQVSTVGKCCLTSDTSLPSVGEHGVIVGWGSTSPSGSGVSNDLLQGVIQVQSDSSVCSTAATSSYQFCAGYSGTSSCYGDSGGPFMTSVNNSWTCTGLVSSGQSCGTNGYYTRVSTYRSFITSIAGV